MNPYSQQGQTQSIAAALTGFGLIIGLISLASIVFAVIIYWRIFSKAGYSGALSLLMFIPIANIVMLCILAFGEWPIYQELNALRQRVASMSAPPQQPYPGYPPQNQPQYGQNPQQYQQNPGQYQQAPNQHPSQYNQG